MNYEKALEKAKERYLKIKDSDSSEKSFLLEIFPELAESEDEKIIKWLIGYFKQYKADGMEKYANGLKVDNILAWLEKQGKEEYALKSFRDKDVRKFMQYIEKEAKAYEFNLPNRGYDIYAFAKDILYWLEKQGECKSSKWTEGDVVRHGGVLALVTNGRKAMKSNCEQITIQYPDEWVKAETKERKYFFEELEKQGEQSQGKSALEVWKDMRLEVYQQASGNRHEPNYSDDSTKMFSLNDIDEIVEKMSEQSPADKVEPKFKVGDFIKHNKANIICKVVSVNSGSYYVEKIETSGRIELFNARQNFHLWTIQDAKDGDVLASELCDSIILFKSIKDNNIDFYCDYDFSKIDIPGDRFSVNNGQHYGNVEDSKDFHPATKEQRDLLFQKMHEAGYEWGVEKKELEKIPNALEECEIEPFEAEHGKYYYCIKDYFCGGRKQASKGDVVQALRGLPIMGLKDASEYFLPVNLIKCYSARSEEDEKNYRMIQKIICDSDIKTNWANKLSDWLKSLQDRVVQPQPKQEWSEEDEEALCVAIIALEDMYDEDSPLTCYAGHHMPFDKAANQLKSLRPQKQWKPSEEQLEALESAIENCAYSEYQDCLKELLKKLKGE